MNMIISDLDKTLVTNHGMTLSDSTVSTINEVRKNDVFIVATGRVLKNVYSINKSYNFIDYIIASNGAVIYDVTNKTVLAHKNIPKEIVSVIIENTQNKYDVLDLCTINNWYRKQNKIVESIFDEIKIVEEFKDIIDKELIYKCEIYYEKIDELIQFYNQILNLNLPLEYVIVSSDNKHYLEITYKNINKKNGCYYLKNMYKLEKMITFGDSMNDYEMLKNSDIKICPENSIQAIKDICDYIILPPESLGVEKWLQDNYLKKV